MEDGPEPNPKSATAPSGIRQPAIRAGDGQHLQRGELAARRRVQLHADRDQPVAVAELGKIGRDIANGADPHRVGDRLRADAEPAGLLVARHHADFRAVHARHWLPRRGSSGRRRIAPSSFATARFSATGSSPSTVTDSSRSPRSLTSQPCRSGIRWPDGRDSASSIMLLAAARDPPSAPAPPPRRPCGSTRRRPGRGRAADDEDGGDAGLGEELAGHGIGLGPRVGQRGARRQFQRHHDAAVILRRDEPGGQQRRRPQ